MGEDVLAREVVLEVVVVACVVLCFDGALRGCR